MSAPKALRLSLLGSIQPQSQLTVYAEFGSARAVAHPTMATADLEELLRRMGELRGFIESGYPPAYDRLALEKLGAKLFELLLSGNVRTLYTGTTGARAGGFIALELLAEDPALAAWPWEYVYDTATGMFLSQEFFPIARLPFIGDPGAISAPGDRDMRLLVVMGAPDPELALEEEVQSIRERFASFVARDAIELAVVQDASPTQLQEHLDDGADIVHFLGHAGFDATRGEGYLELVGADGKPFNLYATALGQLLAGNGVRLVFLNACETAAGSESANVGRSSLAGALLLRGIPTVIATQFAMPDNTAQYFAARTYGALARGKPVVEAVRSARHAMLFGENASFCDWGIPVLYSSQSDLVLFPATAGAPARAPAAAVPVMPIAPSARGGGHAPCRMAFLDIDARVGFLPELTAAANKAQSYYDFRVVFLPIPSGAVRRDLGGDTPQLYLPRVEEYLAKTPTTLDVDVVCCLTAELLAGTEPDGSVFWNYYASPIDANEKVVVISTNRLRERAKRAGVTFAKATLFLCLGQLLLAEGRWKVGYHEATKGCLFDFNEQLDSLVVGLQHMKFDHGACRRKVKDAAQLAAIDALLSLEDVRT